jgi:hypothetical protein
MNKSEQFNVTKQQIARAAEICQQVGDLLKANKPEKDLTKSSPSDEFFQDPASVILSEDAIRTAPESFVALAAFIAQAVEGLQNGFNILNQKVDYLMGKYAETTGAVLKAQSDTLDLVKASLDATPATGFRAPAAYVPQQPMQRAKGQEPTKAFIIDQLEHFVELKKATIQDVALFESSNRLAPHLKEMIDAAWAQRNN